MKDTLNIYIHFTHVFFPFIYSVYKIHGNTQWIIQCWDIRNSSMRRTWHLSLTAQGRMEQVFSNDHQTVAQENCEQRPQA